MRICNENESISSIKRSGRAHDKDCNKKRKRHPIHSCDNFKIAKRTQSDTAFIRSEDKDCWENGKESKINQFSWQSWDCTYAYSIFSLTQYLHENMCIAIKCYLLENVIFIFYFFYLFFLSFYFQFLFPFSLSLLCLLCFSFFLSSFIFNGYKEIYIFKIIKFNWKLVSSKIVNKNKTIPKLAHNKIRGRVSCSQCFWNFKLHIWINCFHMSRKKYELYFCISF